MPDWDRILDESQWLAREFRRRRVDLSEAKKAGDYYASKSYDDKAMGRYLKHMADRPPPRSRRSQPHFENLNQIWQAWHTTLKGRDKARAWGWGIREARALKG